MSKALSVNSSTTLQRITETMFRQIGYSSIDKAKSSAEGRCGEYSIRSESPS